MQEYEWARPFIYLFPMVTDAGRQVKPASGNGTVVYKTIAEAEYQLIGQALHVNPDLYNVQDAKSQRRFVIEGTPRADARERRSAQSFRSMMGFELKKRAPSRLSEATLAAVQGEEEAEEALSHQDPAVLVPEAPVLPDHAAE